MAYGWFVLVAWIIGLFVAGFIALRRPWVWLGILSASLGVAGWAWLDGAYSDSGNALGFSAMGVWMMLVPALFGAVVGLIVRVWRP